MKIGHEENEYGTLVTRFKCDHCGSDYTVCPAVEPDREDQWNSCLGVGCSSYDPSRDADRLFDVEAKEGPEIIQRPVRYLNS